MNSRHAQLLAIVTFLAAPAAAGSIGECPGGNCPARDSLKTLSDTSPGAYGRIYEQSNSVSPGADGITPDAGERRQVRLTPPQPYAPRQAVGDLAVTPEKEEGSGIGGFLNKHKWQIGGAIAGGLLTLLMGGGIFGILAGIAVSLAISYGGPKLFGEKE